MTLQYFPSFQLFQFEVLCLRVSCVEMCFSPTALALGSSVIVKVSGQNCFRTLMVLWGRSVLGRQKVPRKVTPRFQQGCTKVPPKFFKFRGVSGFLAQTRLGLPKGSVEGFTEVSRRFHQGSSSFVVSLVFWGRSVLGCQKVLWKVHQGSTWFHQDYGFLGHL